MWQLMENIIEQDDVDQLINFLNKTDRFTNGPNVREFERQWSDWLGIENSIMVNSGASGNYITIALVKELFGKGEIIVPSLGWSSDVSSIIQLGMTPVFVDISPKTLGINPNSLKIALNENTKAVVVVHALGLNAISDEVKDILDESKVFVIEDCCESHGAKIRAKNNERVGTYGDISVFSFYYGHHITTIEGGVLSTNDETLYQMCKMFRSHGMTREASTEVRKKYEMLYPDLNPLFTFALAGFNFRSTEINAVLGLSQINKLDKNISLRNENLNIWLDNLCSKKFKTDYERHGSSSFALPIILNEPDLNLKKMVCSVLDCSGLEYRLGTAGGGNLARQPFVKNSIHRVVDDQAIVNHVHDFGLYVGNGGHVDEASIKHITAKLNAL